MDKATLEKLKKGFVDTLKEEGVTDEEAINDALQKYVGRIDESQGETDALAERNQVQGQAEPSAESAKQSEPANNPKGETVPSAEGGKQAESQAKPEAKEGEAPKAEAGQTAPQGAQAAPQTQPANAQQAVQPQQPLANVEELTTKIADQNETIKALEGRLKADEELLSKLAQVNGVKGDEGGQSVAFGARTSPEAHKPNESDDEEYKKIAQRVGAHW